MSAAIGVRQDFDAATLRRLATTVKDADQVRRLLAVAAVYDGMSREEAARIGGMGGCKRRSVAASKSCRRPIAALNSAPPNQKCSGTSESRR